MPAFTDKELRNAVAQGLTNAEIAQKLGCDKSTVSRRLKKLNLCRVSQAAHQANLSLRKDVDIVRELRNLYQRSQGLLDKLEGVLEGEISKEEMQDYIGRKSLIELILETKKEIRSQIRLMNDVSESIFNVRMVQDFQQTVVDEIRRESPELAKRIISRLTQYNAAYNCLDPEVDKPRKRRKQQEEQDYA